MNSTRQIQFSDALLWGCFKYHVNQLRTGDLSTRQKVYHFTMAALELLPGLSQVISIIEVIAHKIFSTKEASSHIDLPSPCEPDQEWFLPLMERAARRYQTPYPDEKDDIVHKAYRDRSWSSRAYQYTDQKGDQYTVYRPNHGLTHGGRIAVLTEILMRTIEKDARFGKLHAWAKKKTSKDVDFMRPVLAVGALHRAGRTGESPKTKKMMPLWKEMFHEEAEHFKFKQDITDSCVETFGFHAEAVESDKYSGEDAEYISRITNIAHFSDHRRIPGWNVETSHAAQAMHLARCDVEWGFALKAVGVLWEHSKDLLKATGSTCTGDLHKRGIDNKGSVDLFAKLENDPKRLAGVLEPFRRRTLDIPATGGAGSDQ